jgi:hypothetical protein
VDELDRVPAAEPLGVLKPLSVSVMVKLVLAPGVVGGVMETPPVSNKDPPVDAPDQLLLPPSPVSWSAEPSAVSSKFTLKVSTVP